MKNVTTLVAWLSLSAFLLAGDYPIIVNNFDIEPDRDNDGHVVPGIVDDGIYILYRNRLIRDDRHSEGSELDENLPESSFPMAQVQPSYTECNGSPRNYYVGYFDESKQKFIYQTSKFVSPYLTGTSANKFLSPALTEPVFEYGIENLYRVFPKPHFLDNNSLETKSMWVNSSKYYYRLDPPFSIEYINLPENDAASMEADENYVQGIYELGGGIVCGRRENGLLSLYRLSCSQRTHPNPIELFNPDQKLTWDMEKSDAAHLSAFLHLRSDLLEHNTGTTENRMYVRMKPFHVKLDKPGQTKAMRDWYLLAPFYDPATQTYRDTLTRQDFVADVENNFDPNNEDFDPSQFVKRLVPFTIPESFWDN